MSEVDDGYTLGAAGEIYAEQRAQWEPLGPWDWYKIDPLRRALSDVEMRLEEDERSIALFHQSWVRLPPSLRAQVFREREIAAELVVGLPWLRRAFPSVVSVSVGFDAPHEARLSGIVTVESPLTRGELRALYAAWEERNSVESAVPDYRNDGPTPIVVKVAETPVALKQVPSGAATVSVPDPPPATSPILQSGDRVDSESPSGMREPGTLTCIVSELSSDAPLLLSSGHVFTDSGYAVISRRGAPVRVGTVTRVNRDVDAALAEITEPYSCDYRLKVCDMLPASPVIPPAGLAVQMYGAVSHRQQGYLNETNRIPANAWKIGMVPEFTADIPCTGGDSGALLVTGRDKEPPFSKGELDHMAPAYADAMTCAMLGVLRAGPPLGADPAYRPQAYFKPIIQILDALGIEPWTR